MTEEQKSKPSAEADYFAKAIAGHDHGVMRIVDSVIHSIAMVNFFMLSEIVAEGSGHDPVAIRKNIIDKIFKVIKKTADKQIQQHTAMCETTIGKVLQNLTGDGEAIRVGLYKDIKQAREIFDKVVEQHDPNALGEDELDAQD
jgi:hypothetical protein